MNRRSFLKWNGLAAGAILLKNQTNNPFQKSDFGQDFKWGVAAAAYQIEGAWDADGKGPSIWDHFTQKRPGKIKTKENGNVACDFYNKFQTDIPLISSMGFDVFRFSSAWSRVLPEGTGKVNNKGLDFYNKVVDTCLENNLEPWLTLYHWDLPLALEKKGGWANRDIISWFAEYTELMSKTLGDRVKNWMVLNEPMAFTALGYLIGMHAPGKIAPNLFLKSAHHTSMVQSHAARILRQNHPNAQIGTTFSCSKVMPVKETKIHKSAAHRMDILLNRLYIEPALGLGYPTEGFPFLKGIYKYVKEGDMEKLPFQFDFIGIQNYTRVVTKSAAFIPFLAANQVKPEKRSVPKNEITDMGWEVYPQGIYEIIKQFSNYKNIPPIIVTENGSAFPDEVQNDQSIHDYRRIQFFKDYLNHILKAKKEGVNIKGYFVWTFMDNFEWAEGYKPRFGLVHVDYTTQERRIKDSGKWFSQFLKK